MGMNGPNPDPSEIEDDFPDWAKAPLVVAGVGTLIAFFTWAILG